MDDRPDPDVLIRREPTKRIMTIKRPSPTLWMQIIKEIKPFIRCQTSCLNGNDDIWITMIPTQLPQPTPSTVSNDESVPAPRFPLMKLPNELIIEILEWSVGGYDLEAYSPASPGFGNILIFERPRSWDSIPLFRVCKAIRNQAIQMYGEPHRQSLPFNPIMDRLVLSRLIGDDGFRELTGKEFSLTTKRFSDLVPLLVLEKVYCFCMMIHGGTNNESRRPCGAFFERVRRMDVTLLTRAFLGRPSFLSWRLLSWQTTFLALSSTLPNLEILRISTYGYDNCRNSVVRFHTQNTYRFLDMVFFDGFRFAATLQQEYSTEENSLEFFARLKQVQVVRFQTRCTRTLPRGFYPMPVEEYSSALWAYDAGVKDEWYWERLDKRTPKQKREMYRRHGLNISTIASMTQ